MNLLNSTHYGNANEHPALLILHGLFGSSTNWRSIARQLSQQFQVFTLDLRNHGASFWDDSMDYPTLASDIAHFIDHNQLGSVNIIGHSMGGKTAMCLALNQPELINKLLIVDIAPVPYQHTHLPLIDAMLQLDLNTISSRSQADQALQETISNTGERLFLLQNLMQKDGQFQWRINLPVLRETLPNVLDFPAVNAVFDKPTLFLYGSNSDYVLPSYDATVMRYFPQAQKQAVTNAGHWLHAEQPAETIAAAQQFFDAD